MRIGVSQGVVSFTSPNKTNPTTVSTSSFEKAVQTQKGYELFKSRGFTQNSIIDTLKKINPQTDVEGLRRKLNSFETSQCNPEDVAEIGSVANTMRGSSKKTTQSAPTPSTPRENSTPSPSTNNVVVSNNSSEVPNEEKKMDPILKKELTKMATNLRVPESVINKIYNNIDQKLDPSSGVMSLRPFSTMQKKKAEEFLKNISDDIKITIKDLHECKESIIQGELGISPDQYKLEGLEHCLKVKNCHHYALGQDTKPSSLDDLIRRAGNKTIAICFKGGEVAHTAVFNTQGGNSEMPWIQALPNNIGGSSVPIFRVSKDGLNQAYNNQVLVYNPSKCKTREEKAELQRLWNSFTGNQ
ncbi:MAG: hypothetical protein U0457_13825 [Candidatus Sericytochromatia bacterium]